MPEIKHKKSQKFFANLPDNFVMPSDFVGQKLLGEYGAMFIARDGVILPNTVVFKDEEEVINWQNKVPQTKERIGNIEIELQTPAMKSLKDAVAEAGQNNLTITPRGTDSAKRNYQGTVELWASRVNPGLTHWTVKEKITESEAERIRALSPFEQVSEILKLETKKIFFAKDLSKSIIYSVAPPGTSQHISMLALDVSEYNDQKVRDILAKYGWFQTVVSDLPHFTFLGVPENQLSDLGLQKLNVEGRKFWIPNI